MKSEDRLHQKIYTSEEIGEVVKMWKDNGEVIVFTNGCFDIIHRGHIDYLSKASGLGSRLIIGLNSDSSVKRLKGHERPYQDELSRALILASMFFVDAVVLFGEDTPYNLIRRILPDVLVKGSDYRADDIVGYDIVTESGGKVATIEFLEGYSTSGIVSAIRGGGR